MKRREFLHTGLRFGAAAGLLSEATAGFDNARPITESATDKVSEGVIRYFYNIEKKQNGNRTRTTYKGLKEPPEGTHPALIAAVREDWDTFRHCVDEKSSLLYSVTGNVSIRSELCRLRYYRDLPLIHVIATWADNGQVLRFVNADPIILNLSHRCGGTPLHFAVRWSPNVDAVKYLLSKGVDVNAKDRRGRTPLHLAAGCNPNVEVAKCLVGNGAVIRAEDDEGLTPLDVSFRYAKSDEVGLYFMELMTGSKGVKVTDPAILARFT